MSTIDLAETIAPDAEFDIVGDFHAIVIHSLVSPELPLHQYSEEIILSSPAKRVTMEEECHVPG